MGGLLLPMPKVLIIKHRDLALSGKLLYLNTLNGLHHLYVDLGFARVIWKLFSLK